MVVRIMCSSSISATFDDRVDRPVESLAMSFEGGVTRAAIVI